MYPTVQSSGSRTRSAVLMKLPWLGEGRLVRTSAALSSPHPQTRQPAPSLPLTWPMGSF